MQVPTGWRSLRGLRRVSLACAAGLGLVAIASAQTASRLAFPYYTAEQALTGLYARQLPPRAQAFDVSAQALVQATQAHCQARIGKDALHTQWQQTLLRWQALATPAVGPLLQRRSQRQIDFWPVRPNLIDKALKGTPRELADMARVGTPAKGFAGFEYLLAESPAAGLQGEAHRGRCAYAVLVAQGIAAEAGALRAEFAALVQRNWQVDEESADAPARVAQTGAAFAEWVNQWLGGLERLRWLQMEQPLVKAQTAGKPPAFPRQDWADNLADWRAQWESLRAQALLGDPQTAPPVPGQDFVPIEALLYGKGQVQLAARWRQAITVADAAMSGLSATYNPKELEAATRKLKELTVLYQQQVATALDVPLGFSDADGD
ncbi:imelysin family protein [Hylemonella sp. W303a]|uniref:imelysin family protein n=1 Tax=Hylemonella sp. W303a TaxID=3389873 RepID=UPI00396B4839